TSGGGHVMYLILWNAFECALPMKAYPSIPTPISAATARDTTRMTTWGIISTAHINRLVIPGARESSRVDLIAVASRDQAPAHDYARKWDIERADGSYEALLDDVA